MGGAVGAERSRGIPFRTMKKILICAGAVAAILAACPARGHVIAVDLDLSTAGVQSTLAVEEGGTFQATLVLVPSSGGPALSAVALATMWNDTAGVITPTGSASAAGGSGFFGFPSRHIATGAAVTVGDSMVGLGIGSFGAGLNGAFQDGDGGTGVYGDFINGTPATTLSLWTFEFQVTGSAGETTEIRPYGIVDPASTTASAVPGIAAGGVEFFDWGVFGAGGAGPVAGSGIQSAFVNVITPVPEPSVAWLSALAGLSLAVRKRR